MLRFSHLLICIIQVAWIQGQTNGLRFNNLTVDDGLTQNSANVIYQDTYGYIWLGTQDGLNRYNGFTFKTYRHQDNVESISNNYIWDVYQQNDSILWVVSFGGGLSKINLLNNKIENYNTSTSPSLPSNRMFSITSSSIDELWIGCNEGLLYFNTSDYSYEMFLNQKDEGGESLIHYVGSTEYDDHGLIWFSCDTGLAAINPSNKALQYYPITPFSGNYRIGEVHDIQHYEESVYIACSIGLIKITSALKTDTLLLSTDRLDRGVIIQKILRADKNVWYLGTNKGVYIWDRKTDVISQFVNDSTDPESIAHNNVISLCQSHDGVIWIGTRNGVSQIRQPEPDFDLVRSISGRPGLLSSHVSSFIEQGEKLWIGTNIGLQRFDLLTKQFETWSKDLDDNSVFASSYILTLYQDTDERMLIGTKGGGAYSLNLKNREVEFTKLPIPGGETLSIHQFHISEDGSIWIGTSAKGLWKFDPKLGEVKKFESTQDSTGLSHTYVFCLEEDSKGRIWIGTPTGGLNMYDATQNKFLHFIHNENIEGSISNNIILDIYIDAEGYMWIGTLEGLNKSQLPIAKYSTDTLSYIIKNDLSLFDIYSKKDGFLNEVIYGILEDEQNLFWITTNYGLAVFSKEKQKVIRSFTKNSGLQSNEFNQNAFLKGPSGRMYIGGVNGFNYFYPDSIQNKMIPPKVVFEGISLFNELVRIDSSYAHGFSLEKHLQNGDTLRLSYKHNVVTFHFSTVSYINPDAIQFYYKLEGFNDKWVYGGSEKSVTYTNLNPGNYTFMVRAANESGIMTETPQFLKLSISTPPWKMWYAYFVYSLLLLGGIYTTVKLRVRKATQKLKLKSEIEQARAEERELFRKRSAADFHDEAGKHITKINLLSELAKTQPNLDRKVQEVLVKIQSNTTLLSTSMRDFLWTMDVKMDNAFELFNKLSDAGNYLFSDTDIQFQVSISDGLEKLPLDSQIRKASLQIGKEAFLNIAKHANATLVQLEMKLAEDHLSILIVDDGVGFNMNEDFSGHYGLQLMLQRAEDISGIFEVHSVQGKGTTVKLSFKLTHMG